MLVDRYGGGKDDVLDKRDKDVEQAAQQYLQVLVGCAGTRVRTAPCVSPCRSAPQSLLKRAQCARLKCRVWQARNAAQLTRQLWYGEEPPPAPVQRRQQGGLGNLVANLSGRST
jgi:hypothetical protein